MNKIFLSILLSLGGLFLFSGCQTEDNSNRALVISQIQNASKLSTVEYVVSKIVIGRKEKKLLGFPLRDASFLATTEASIKVGIDLAKITSDDVEEDGDKITIQLPPVEVINFSYPAEKFKVDSDLSKDWDFNSINVEDMDFYFREAELDIRENLPRLGIYNTAQSRTRIFIENLLKRAGYKEIYIHYGSTEAEAPEKEAEEALDLEEANSPTRP